MARVNALLGAISHYKPLAEWFAPTEEHKRKGTWASAASLFQQDEWIQFLQNTTDSTLLSLIIPDRGPFLPVKTVPIEEGLAWVYVLDETASSRPFLGIQVQHRMITERENGGEMGALGVLPAVYVLYDVERLKALTLTRNGEEDFPSYVPIPFSQGVEIEEMQFLSDLTRALHLVRSSSFTVPVAERVFQDPILVKDNIKEQSFQEEVQGFLKERTAYASELFLLWQAAILQQLGALGTQTLWPDAMTFCAEGGVDGQVFFLHSVMGFSDRLFDDETFYEKNDPKQANSFVSSGSCVIKGLKENQVFLGNTAALFEKEKNGNSQRSLLTLGVDLRDLLSDIVTTSNCYGIIVSGGAVLALQSPEDKPPLLFSGLNSSLEEKTGLSEGFLSLGADNYHFFHIQPDKEMDLHFFLLNLKQDAFDFSYNFQIFQEQMQGLLEKLDVDRRTLEGCGVIILWLLLLRLSKKITKPIIVLSASLAHVKKGEWDQIQFPDSQFQKKNEIKMLCDSFRDMVEGMKEKEKVEGILNKVVSPEIAKEILKGEVTLGGEERVVTMLFADIRGFTQLTQNMAPHEVIFFLNTCMTKLSAIVEEHRGVIDKYLGDGLMALYGAPIAYEESALHAINAGLEMLKAMEQWNQSRQIEGLLPVSIGIGIHTGSVCVGNMGAQNRLNYTAIGSAVNMASRLCSSAEAGALLITEETYQQPLVQQIVQVTDRGFFSLKGFDEKKQVFQVTGFQRL